MEQQEQRQYPMDSFGVAKSGRHAGEWFISTGFTRIRVVWTRDGKEKDAGFSSGRTYLYPQEGDIWKITDYYFDKEKIEKVYQFHNNQFVLLEYTEFSIEWNRSYPKETVVMEV